MSRSSTAILILGTADWNQPIATNQHYMARALDESFDVTFVESLALRRPTLTRRDLKRIWSRVKRAVSRRPRASDVTAERSAGDIEVLSPLILPLHFGPFAWLNKLLLHRLFSRWAREKRDAVPILWVYTPTSYGLERRVEGAVYHCVDLLSEVPGISKTVVGRAERRLADAGATAIATSTRVETHLRARGFDPLFWPNVADTDAVIAEQARADSRRPRAVFAGNLTSFKIDFPLLERVVRSGVDLHLAGPVSEGGDDASKHVQRLVELGATYHGMLDFAELARLYWSCSCGLIPYALNSYTLGVSPLKTYEYLAAGMAVVSTNLPGTPRNAHVTIASGHDEFVQAVSRHTALVAEDVLSSRQDSAIENSWARRGSDARDLVRLLTEQGTS